MQNTNQQTNLNAAIKPQNQNNYKTEKEYLVHPEQDFADKYDKRPIGVDNE
jgi:hypothetical protein